MPTPNNAVSDPPSAGTDSSRPGRPQLACPDEAPNVTPPISTAIDTPVVSVPPAPPNTDVATTPHPETSPIPTVSSSTDRNAPCPAPEPLRLDGEAPKQEDPPWSPPASSPAGPPSPSATRNVQSPTAVEEKALREQRTRASPNHTLSNTHLPYTPSPRYDISNRRVLKSYTSSYLRPGRVFQGKQTSDRSEYKVQVELKHVDMSEAFLCGYLRIEGLTEDHPTLTTYFEGEMIDGVRYAFQTRRPEWGSNEKNDFHHWRMFEGPFDSIYAQAKRPGFVLKDFHLRDNIFMRWKEHFLVPDHRLKQINGASFEGFYYIMFNQYKGTVSGYYYHARSERGQELKLDPVDDRTFSSFEFR